MTFETIALLAAMIFAAAVLYSSVGHAGASAYLAAMALVGVEPAVMRPTALCLNVLVASLVLYQFARVGCFSWSRFWPLAVSSVPMAAVGGAVILPGEYFRPLVGLALLLAAVRLALPDRRDPASSVRFPPLPVALLVGAAIGFLAGLTGTGGGIYLTPILVLARWSDPRTSAGLSAAFVLANSVAGLAGLLSRSPTLPAAVPVWAVAAVTGGLVGSYFGSRRFGGPTLRRLLAAVLVIAGLKFIGVSG